VEKELPREEETVGCAERGAARSRKIPPGVSQEGARFIFLINIWVQSSSSSYTEDRNIEQEELMAFTNRMERFLVLM